MAEVLSGKALDVYIDSWRHVARVRREEVERIAAGRPSSQKSIAAQIALLMNEAEDLIKRPKGDDSNV